MCGLYVRTLTNFYLHPFYPRCLGLGRPFALELNAYDKTLSSLLRAHSSLGGKQDNGAKAGYDRANDLSWLASTINKSTGDRVFVRDLQVSFHWYNLM